MTINIRKAQGYEGNPIEDLLIRISEEMPNHPNTTSAYKDFEKDAKALFIALTDCLPGGTLDQLLLLLLKQKASQFVVPYAKFKENAL